MYRSSFLITALILLVFLGIPFIGCSDDDDDDDDNPADDDDDDNDAVDDDDDNTDDDTTDDDDDDDWDNLSDPLGPGEVRAGVITSEDELIGGPRARGEIGDYKIYNSKIEVIIRSTDLPGIGWSKYSGNIIDVDRARPVDEPGADSLWAMEQIISLARAFLARQIEVTQSGIDGTAIIRVTGIDGGLDVIDAVAPTWNHGLTITNEYVLLPDKDYLTIRTILSINKDNDRKVLAADIALWADETAIFSPRTGFETGEFDIGSAVRWVGGVSRLDLPVSYALATADPSKKLYAPYIDGEILPLVDGLIEIPLNGTATYERLLIVGEGDTSSFDEVIFEYDNNTDFGTIEGVVSVPAKGDTDGLNVMVTDDRPDGSNFVHVLNPGQSGQFSVKVKPGNYTLYAYGEGRINSAETTVTVTAGSTETANLSIGDPGYLSFEVVDENSDPTPCRISIMQGHDAPATAGILKRIWSVNGLDTIRILPGQYTVYATRGWEYEIDSANITVTEGAIAQFDGMIERVVDTSNHMTGDFHIHTEFSMDSQALAQSRVRELIAEGIEIPVFTDHDTVADFAPYVQDIQAEDLILPVRGNEISPPWGHSNAWPLVPPASAPDYYGIGLVDYDEFGTATHIRQKSEIWDIARNDFGAQIVQVNHPRSGGNGWFNFVGYDPAVGVSSVNPNLWTDDFDAIEVFNSGNDHEGSLTDWFSFLDQGFRFTLTGNSDSHSPGSQLGNPRNIFYMPTDDPYVVDEQDMVDSILAGRNQVSNGPFVTFEIEGQSIGGFVTGLDKTGIDLTITIQAPSWMEVDYLRIYTNHQQLVDDIFIPDTDQVVRYDDIVTLSPSQDAYFVIEAGHTSATLAPINRGERVFVMTNPIWVDVDGNGVFDPPGISLAFHQAALQQSSSLIDPSKGSCNCMHSILHKGK